MKNTQKELEEVEKMAELQFTTDECSIVTGINIEESQEALNAWMKGRLKAQAIVRRQILDLAKNGSTPAAKQFMDLVENSEYEEDD